MEGSSSKKQKISTTYESKKPLKNTIFITSAVCKVYRKSNELPMSCQGCGKQGGRKHPTNLMLSAPAKNEPDIDETPNFPLLDFFGGGVGGSPSTHHFVLSACPYELINQMIKRRTKPANKPNHATNKLWIVDARKFIRKPDVVARTRGLSCRNAWNS